MIKMKLDYFSREFILIISRVAINNNPMITDEQHGDVSEEVEILPSPPKRPKKIGYDRCRNPFDHTRTCSRKGLRNPSQRILQLINKHLSLDPPMTSIERLCSPCQKEASELENAPTPSSKIFMDINYFSIIIWAILRYLSGV